MAAIGNIEWYRGDSFPLELKLKDKATGLPLTITGYSFILTVDSVSSPSDASTNIFSVEGIVVGDGTEGKVTFTPTADDTDITPAKYYYDIQMTDPSSNVRTIAKYNFKITQDISK